MQSRLAATAPRSSWAWSLAQFRCLRRALTTSRTADPAVHANDDDNQPAVLSGEPDISQDNLEPDNAKADYERDEAKEIDSNGPFGPPKAQYASSPRLETTPVGQASKPITQQKRAHHNTVIDNVSCIGVYGGPLSDKEENREADRKEQEEDDREYYKHHKASPLAEIEIAETRKPITAVTDSTRDEGEDVIGWLPEQLDSEKDSLERAREIWKENAMRGDPDAPQSKVLRALRGEEF